MANIFNGAPVTDSVTGALLVKAVDQVGTFQVNGKPAVDGSTGATLVTGLSSSVSGGGYPDIQADYSAETNAASTNASVVEHIAALGYTVDLSQSVVVAPYSTGTGQAAYSFDVIFGTIAIPKPISALSPVSEISWSDATEVGRITVPANAPVVYPTGTFSITKGQQLVVFAGPNSNTPAGPNTGGFFMVAVTGVPPA